MRSDGDKPALSAELPGKWCTPHIIVQSLWNCVTTRVANKWDLLWAKGTLFILTPLKN